MFSLAYLYIITGFRGVDLSSFSSCLSALFVFSIEPSIYSGALAGPSPAAYIGVIRNSYITLVLVLG